MPTPTKYTYSIANDFPNGKVATDALSAAITSGSIVTALDYINTSGDDCDVWFKDTLSNDDETTLDGLVAAHPGEHLPSGPQPVTLYTDVTTPAPRTSDGKPIFLPNLFPGNVTLYITGAGDGSSTRGDGTQFTAQRAATGDEEVEWSYIDWVYAAGGGLMWKDAALGDWISLKALAPATAYNPNGGGVGNCNRVEIAPGSNLYMLVPAAGDGAYDVDLVNAAILVPAYGEEGTAGNGYWNWNTPDTGRGNITPSTPGQGGYNLFSFPIDLARFVNRLPILGTGRIDITVPAIKPKKILPHWKLKIILHNESGDHTTQVVWFLTTARSKTV